jgi:plastocyanin
MKRRLVPIALAALVLALTPAVASSGQRTIEVRDFSFAPSSPTIRSGTLVRFNWVGDSEHNVTKASGPGRFFQSKTQAGDGILYKRRFWKRGRYVIICTLHDGMTMNLRVKRKRRRG